MSMRIPTWLAERLAKSREVTRRSREYNASHADSRPVRRRKARMESFAEITKKFPGEPRSLRRRMAFDRVRNLARRYAA
jgi:hypothetical protein